MTRPLPPSWIRSSREEKQWTRAQVAIMLSVAEADVAAWEAGSSEPDAEAARQLRVAFGEPPDAEPSLAEQGPEPMPPQPEADPGQRGFYLRMTRRMGWTRRVLVHQIKSWLALYAVAAGSNSRPPLPATEPPPASD